MSPQSALVRRSEPWAWRLDRAQRRQRRQRWEAEAAAAAATAAPPPRRAGPGAGQGAETPGKAGGKLGGRNPGVPWRQAVGTVLEAAGAACLGVQRRRDK